MGVGRKDDLLFGREARANPEYVYMRIYVYMYICIYLYNPHRKPDGSANMRVGRQSAAK